MCENVESTAVSIIGNETMESILKRRSIRLYKPEMPTDAEMDTVLSAALYAPSARNLQPNHVRIVKDKALLDELNKDFKAFVGENTPAYTGWQEQPFYHDAPVFAMIFGDRENHYTPVDAGIMVENMAIAAQSVGLGSCIIGCIGTYMNSPEGAKWRERFDVPENCDFMIGITLGYADEVPEMKPRYEDRIEEVL